MRSPATTTGTTRSKASSHVLRAVRRPRRDAGPIAADGGVSSTTDAKIEELIERAATLRREYGVPTGTQHAPFFQVQTPEFALLRIDTGVLRGVDPEELTWLRAALEASRGKMVMAVLGHPFFAGGHDVAATTTSSWRFAISCASTTCA